MFRRLAGDISVRYRKDDGVCKALEEAQALGSLNIKNMTDELRPKVMQAIKIVAEEPISGKNEGRKPQVEGNHAIYCEALSELVKLVEQQQNATRPDETC